MESLARPAGGRLEIDPSRSRTATAQVIDAARVRPWHVATLAGMVGVAWAAFTWALLSAHRSYHSNAFDLGFFDQIIWNTSRGRWFQTNFVDYNFLGQHVEPVLLLYAAAYRVLPGVELLLVSQATVVALAAVPLFLAARRLLASATAAVLVAAAYLLSSHVHGAVLFDFHPEVMGIAGVFGALALIVSGRPGWALLPLAAIFLLKEDAALVAVGFAIVFWLFGHRRHALAVVIASILYLIVVAGIVMPALRGGPGDLQDRYGYLGADAGEIIAGAVRGPDVVVGHLVAGPQIRATTYLLATQAFLPLLNPAALGAAPLLAANLLSTHPAQHDLTLQYPVLIYALLFASAVLTIRWLAHSPALMPLRRRLQLTRASTAIVLAVVLLATEAAGWMFGSPLGPRRFDAERYQRTSHHVVVDRVLAAVPPEAPVSAQSGLLPHLSQRREVWEFPRLENAAFVVVDRTAWRSSQSRDTGYDRVLDSLPSLGFCVLLHEDGVTLYARGPRCASR